MSISPVVPRPVDVIELKLESLILGGALRPGMKLPAEGRLANDMGVSRTTLREAISRLRVRGLLHTEGGAHRVSEVLDAVLSSSLGRLRRADGEDLVRLWGEIVRFCLQSAERTALETDSEAVATAYRRWLEAVRGRSAEATGAHFVDLWMCVAESSYNVLAIHTVHALLVGFEDLFARCVRIATIDARYPGADGERVPEPGPGTFAALAALCDAIVRASGESAAGATYAGAAASSAPPAPQDVAFEALRVEIVDAKAYAIGEALPSTRSLAGRYGVSDNAVRLALQQAESAKLVSIVRQHQAVVVSRRPHEPLDYLVDAILRQPFAMESIFEFRIMLERRSVTLAAGRLRRDDKRELARLVKAMDEGLELSASRFGALDIRFHGAIAKHSGDRAVDALQSAFGRLLQSVIQYWLDRYRTGGHDLHEIQRQHHRILAALKADDALEASAAMTEHLRYVLDELKAFERRATLDGIAEARVNIRRSFAGG